MGNNVSQITVAHAQLTYELVINLWLLVQSCVGKVKKMWVTQITFGSWHWSKLEWTSWGNEYFLIIGCAQHTAWFLSIIKTLSKICCRLDDMISAQHLYAVILSYFYLLGMEESCESPTFKHGLSVTTYAPILFTFFLTLMKTPWLNDTFYGCVNVSCVSF